MARNAYAKKVVGEGSVTFNFSNGKSLVAAIADIPQELRDRLALHGLGQKVGDSYAGAESVEDAVESAGDVYEMLVGGKWTERTAGEPRTSALAEALARVMTEAGQPKSVEEATAAVKGMDDETRKNLRNQPSIKAAMSAIKAERDAAAAAGKPLDMASLFAKA